jgi:hypothetical protein
MRDAPEFLVVLVEERAGVAGDVADRCGRHPVRIPQAAQAPTGEHPVHRGGWQAEKRAKSIGAIPPGLAGGQDLGLLACTDRGDASKAWGLVVVARAARSWDRSDGDATSLARRRSRSVGALGTSLGRVRLLP